jgi:hypothetical protein
MKRFRLTLILLILVAALGGYVWFFERGEVGAPPAWKLETNQVRRIELRCGGKTTVVVRQGSSWHLVKPISARADPERMKQVLERVGKLEVRRRIEHAKRLKDYGLAKPAAAIKVVLANGDSREMALGDRTPDSAAVYAVRKGSPEVFLVDTALLEDATGGADALRDRTALPFDRGKAVRVVIARRRTAVTLEKRGQHWQIVAPFTGDADPAAVDDFLVSLEGVQATRFAAEEAQDPAAFGLSAPRLTIEVSASAQGEPARLRFGAKADRSDLYAQNSSGPAVMVVPKSSFDQVNKSADDLRSKQIVSIDVEDAQRIAIMRGAKSFELRREGEGWRLTSPRRLAADSQKVEDLLWQLSDLRAEGFVDSPGPVASYGLEPLRDAVTVYFKRRKQPARLWFGGPAGPKRIYVKTAAPTIYEASATILSRVPASIDDIRNLTLWSYEAGDIKRLRATYNGRTVVLEREGTKWRLTAPEKRPADAEGMQKLLSVVEAVRAERCVGETPGMLALDPQTLKLTVETTMQKEQTLLARANDGETLVKLEAEPAVFRATPGFLKELRQALDGVARR